jgi:hypothetical protein
MTIKLTDLQCNSGSSSISKSLTVEAPSDTEDISFFYTDRALNASKIRPILVGSTPSVRWSLRHGTDRSAVGTEIVAGGTVTTEVTTGIDVTALTGSLIPANSHVWFETTDVSGIVVSLALTLFLSEA